KGNQRSKQKACDYTDHGSPLSATRIGHDGKLGRLEYRDHRQITNFFDLRLLIRRRQCIVDRLTLIDFAIESIELEGQRWRAFKIAGLGGRRLLITFGRRELGLRSREAALGALTLAPRLLLAPPESEDVYRIEQVTRDL